ncbi:MAG: DUF1698 domain-containing protein [Thermoplasmata archaeon]
MNESRVTTSSGRSPSDLGASPVGPGLSDAEGDREALWREIQAIPWWHRIQVGPFVTPGQTSSFAQDWLGSCLPQSFEGRSVLDIGAWDGYFSFLAEERGARRVVAIDNLKNLEAHPTGSAGFQLAKRVRGSNVEFHTLDVYECDQLAEKFDVIFFFGVYYHLHSPIYALEKIRKLLAPGGTLYMEGLIRSGRDPSILVLNGEFGSSNHSDPTIPAVRRMVTKAGFTSIKTMQFNYGGGWGPKAFGSRIRPRLWGRVMHAAFLLGVKSPAYRGLFEIQ